MKTNEKTYSILSDQLQFPLRIGYEERMLTSPDFLFIKHLIRTLSFAFSILNHHFLSEWILGVDLAFMFGLDGFGWITFLSFQWFSSEEVEAGSVSSFRSFDREILV
jgi:hypothetical protein